jgi:DNA-binding transcriptional regulator GbsR (MarR family)
MSRDKEEKALLQLKVDYIAFMEQTHGALGFEPNLMAVLFSLLLEGDYITQERIMTLTGFGRSTVSETLKNLIDPSSKFPVLVTRKPGNRRKFYYCPLSFDEYVMTFFTSATSASDFTEEILQEMLVRLDTMDSNNRDVQHLQTFFSYLFNVVGLIQNLLRRTGEYLEKFFNDSKYKLEFIEDDFKSLKVGSIESFRLKFPGKKKDSVLAIKQDYIRETLEKATPVGRSREIGAVSLALLLTPDPVTQDEIMKVTGYSRSTVSENLAKIEELKVLHVVKKPGDRKKYYRSTLRFEGYGTQKFQIQRNGYNQIGKMIEGRFLPEVRKMGVETGEIKRVELFFLENVRAYGLIVEYLEFLYEFMLKRIDIFEIPDSF